MELKRITFDPNKMGGQVLLKLRKFFDRNGYLRVPNALRQKKDGQRYKKGYEMRLVARTASELAEMQSLLRRAGIKMGRPFHKGRQIAQPVYGKKAVAEVCDMLGIK